MNTRYHDVAAGHYDHKWGIDFGELGRDLADWQCTTIGAAVLAQRKRLVGRLALAEHQHVGDLAQLGFADLASDRLAAPVELDAITLAADPSARGHVDAVASAIRAIADGALAKVVLARCLTVTLSPVWMPMGSTFSIEQMTTKLSR